MKNRLAREGGEESPDSAGKDDPQQGFSPARPGDQDSVTENRPPRCRQRRRSKGEKVRQELTVNGGDAGD